MAYGRVIGRLSVVRRGKPRKGSRSGDCVHCKLPVVEGTAHFILQRTIKLKKGGKIVWTTRRLHMPCFSEWLKPAETWLTENEKKANARRTGRPRAVLSNLDPYELIERKGRMKRRSYLMNRLLRNPQYDEETRAGVVEEINALADKIDSILPSRRFITQKRKDRSNEYGKQTGRKSVL